MHLTLYLAWFHGSLRASRTALMSRVSSPRQLEVLRSSTRIRSLRNLLGVTERGCIMVDVK
jgi:hypothetical protein